MTFVVYNTSLSATCLSFTPLNVIYPSHKPQIAGLISKDAFTKVLNKYVNMVVIFSSDLASKLLKYTKINDYAIKLVDDKQPSSGPIYSLDPMELETLKAYIKTNLINRFIKSSKSSAGASILFNQKSEGSFQLCINYWGFNNLTIKNQYLLPMIKELLDRLERAK